MKIYFKYLLIYFLGALNACGTQVTLSGKAYEEYQEALKPYLFYWEIPGKTIEGKRIDSWDCGAAPTVHAAEHVVFSPETINAEKRPEEERNKPAIDRLTVKWVECMKDKGYVWVKDQ